MRISRAVKKFCATIGAAIVLLGSSGVVVAGPETFIPLSENPLLAPEQSWEGWNVSFPDAVNTDRELYLFYTGRRGLADSIGFATGFRPTELQRAWCNPVLTGDGTGFDREAVSIPTVVLDDDTWTMFYQGGNGGEGIGRATTPYDPCNAAHLCGWSRSSDPVLVPGRPGEWDSGRIQPNAVIITPNGWQMYYSGEGDYISGSEFMIGLAQSKDGIVWSKYDDLSTSAPPFAESDPVFMPGAPGEWDSGFVMMADVSRTDIGWEMYFTGGTSSFSREGGIGYATSPDGVHWSRHTGNPIMTELVDPFGMIIPKPSIVSRGSVRVMYYDYGLSFMGGIGVAAPDSDSDGLLDTADNCITVANTAQIDSDGDLYGNACDPDLTNDCRVDAADLDFFKPSFFGTDPNSDFNGDGVVNVVDLAILKAHYGRGPGPSGTSLYCSRGFGCFATSRAEGP